MSHLFIKQTMHHHVSMTTHWSIFIYASYQWSIFINWFPLGHLSFSSMHMHCSSIINQSITWYESNQTICINDIWSNNLPNNQTNCINENMIQQSPSLALTAIPTLMSTPITNYWCQHVDKACSSSMVNVTISPHQSLPSIDINHINVIYLSPFDINGKGPFSSWGCSPCLVSTE